MYSRIGKLSVLCAMVWCALAVCADESSVTVTYDRGRVDTTEMKAGIDPFLNFTGVRFSNLPAEAAGLQFTRVSFSVASPVTIHASAGTTVYAVIADFDQNKTTPAKTYLLSQGWHRVSHLNVAGPSFSWIYGLWRKDFASETEVRLDADPGKSGYIIAAQNLSASVASPSNQSTQTNGDPGTASSSVPRGTASLASPTTAPDIHPDAPPGTAKSNWPDHQAGADAGVHPHTGGRTPIVRPLARCRVEHGADPLARGGAHGGEFPFCDARRTAHAILEGRCAALRAPSVPQLGYQRR